MGVLPRNKPRGSRKVWAKRLQGGVASGQVASGGGARMGRPGTRPEVGLLTPDAGRWGGKRATEQSTEWQTRYCETGGRPTASATQPAGGVGSARTQPSAAPAGRHLWPGAGLSSSRRSGTRATGRATRPASAVLLQLRCVPSELAMNSSVVDFGQVLSFEPVQYRGGGCAYSTLSVHCPRARRSLRQCLLVLVRGASPVAREGEEGALPKPGPPSEGPRPCVLDGLATPALPWQPPCQPWHPRLWSPPPGQHSHRPSGL